MGEQHRIFKFRNKTGRTIYIETPDGALIEIAPEEQSNTQPIKRKMVSKQSAARKKVKLINRTPHPINIETVDGRVIEIPPTPPPVRLAEEVVNEEIWDVELDSGEIVQIRVVTKRLQSDGAPPRAQLIGDTFVFDVVSFPVAMSLGSCAPDTGEGSAVRDENGNIKYVKRLCFVETAKKARK